jgi:type IX secretion system PorP/SprF family membrane protein
MKRLKHIVIGIMLAGGLTAQHSTLTSNYLFNVFAVNPAYAGQKKALDINLFYRKQWVGFNGAPQNISILSSMEVKPRNLSVGVQFDNDRIGLTKTNSLRIAFAYRVKFHRKHTVSFALMPGYKRISYDFSKLRLTTEGDATYTANSPAINIFNSGAGVYYYSKKLFFGLSTPEIIRTRSNGKFYEFNAIGGGIIKLNEDIILKPSFLVRQIKNSPVQVDLSITGYFNEVLGVGLSYRNKEAILLYFDFSVNKKFKFGYAYDYSIGPLKLYNKGAHEIMLNYFFGKFTDAPTPRYF